MMDMMSREFYAYGAVCSACFVVMLFVKGTLVAKEKPRWIDVFLGLLFVGLWPGAFSVIASICLYETYKALN